MIMVIKYDHCLDDGDADYYLVSFSTDYEGHVDHRVCQELHVVILARESIPLLAKKHNFEVGHCFSVSQNLRFYYIYCEVELIEETLTLNSI